MISRIFLKLKGHEKGRNYVVWVGEPAKGANAVLNCGSGV